LGMALALHANNHTTTTTTCEDSVSDQEEKLKKATKMQPTAKQNHPNVPPWRIRSFLLSFSFPKVYDSCIHSFLLDGRIQ
jgi:hypothetical protein